MGMLLKNGAYYDENFCLQQGNIYCKGDKISGFSYAEEGKAFDITGLTVLPGLIDVHIHGCAGVSASDAHPEALRKMSRFLAHEGITSFVPTLMTQSYDRLCEEVKAIDLARPAGARIVGIHLEGPWISPEKAGIHLQEYMRVPDYEELRKLDDLSGGKIRIVDIAPELKGSEDFITRASKSYRVGVGHSNAAYDTVRLAATLGASHAVHLFNGMSGLEHRQPGVVGAVLDNDRFATVELICDGRHVHPAVVRLAAKILGPDRLVLISDALAPTGLPEGDYAMGERTVQVHQGAVQLDDGMLAGSAVTLMEMLRRAIAMGVPKEQALRAVTINPARVLGMDHLLGSIAVGKAADFTVVDDQMNVKMVIIGGRPVNRGIPV